VGVAKEHSVFQGCWIYSWAFGQGLLFRARRSTEGSRLRAALPSVPPPVTKLLGEGKRGVTQDSSPTHILQVNIFQEPLLSEAIQTVPLNSSILSPCCTPNQGPDLEIFHLVTRIRCQSYSLNQLHASFMSQASLDFVPICPSLSEKKAGLPSAGFLATTREQ